MNLREVLKDRIVYSLQCAHITGTVPDEQVAEMVLSGLDDTHRGWDGTPEEAVKLAAIEKLAEEWRYKGEFGWGPWQTGEGPGPEDQILDDAAGELRNILNGTCDS